MTDTASLSPTEADNLVRVETKMTRRELLNEALALQVETDLELDIANEICALAKAAQKVIDGRYNPKIKGLRDMAAAWAKERDELKQLAVQAEDVLKGKIGPYLRRREEAERREFLKRQEAALAEERAKRKELADSLRQQGEAASAEVVEQSIDSATVTGVAPKSTSAPSGLSLRTEWFHELLPGGLELLVLATAKDLMLPEKDRRGLIGYLQLNEPAVNGTCGDLKEGTNIPGIRPVRKDVVAQNTRRVLGSMLSK